ncbi:MAG TPA: VOC family protein [Chloroflexota bacterium]|nr:VOC family protein [Chloroflexota bacterium]
MTARVRYLCLVSERPDVLADFYTTKFSMREIGRSERGDVALTDGFYNLSLVKPDGTELSPGFSHFGVEVDDIREVEARLEEFGFDAELQEEPGGLFHGEYRVFDPNGIGVSLSTRHFGLIDDGGPLPRIHHVAMMVPNNNEVLDFYEKVFGFREVSTSKKLRLMEPPNDVTRFAGDGVTSLAILPAPEVLKRYNFEPENTNLKPGPNHFGFLVSDIGTFMERFPEGGRGRPASRPMTEERVHDPDGNAIDVSQHKGYEVDVDTWLRA